MHHKSNTSVRNNLLPPPKKNIIEEPTEIKKYILCPSFQLDVNPSVNTLSILLSLYTFHIITSFGVYPRLAIKMPCTAKAGNSDIYQWKKATANPLSDSTLCYLAPLWTHKRPLFYVYGQPVLPIIMTRSSAVQSFFSPFFSVRLVLNRLDFP